MRVDGERTRADRRCRVGGPPASSGGEGDGNGDESSGAAVVLPDLSLRQGGMAKWFNHIAPTCPHKKIGMQPSEQLDGHIHASNSGLHTPSSSVGRYSTLAQRICQATVMVCTH